MGNSIQTRFKEFNVTAKTINKELILLMELNSISHRNCTKNFDQDIQNKYKELNDIDSHYKTLNKIYDSFKQTFEKKVISIEEKLRSIECTKKYIEENNKVLIDMNRKSEMLNLDLI